jgi:hypothetical protein
MNVLTERAEPERAEHTATRVPDGRTATPPPPGVPSPAESRLGVLQRRANAGPHAAGLAALRAVVAQRATRAGAPTPPAPGRHATAPGPGPSGVVQRTLRVAGEAEFDGEGSIAGAARGRLMALADRYHAPDFYRIVQQIEGWAREFDDFPAHGSFPSWLAAVQQAAGELRIQPLRVQGQAELATDPERLGPQSTPRARRYSVGENPVGSPAYWAAKLLTGRQESGEVVIGGHGYRKPWETDVVTVPDGTTIEFYVLDDEGLKETDAVVLQEHGTQTGHASGLKKAASARTEAPADTQAWALRNKTTFGPGEQVYNYTITPPRPNDRLEGTYVSFSTRRKLSEILAPGLGTLHLAVCREVDWWGGFASMPGGDIHAMPDDWRFVRSPNYMGYVGPGMQQAPGGRGVTRDEMRTIHERESREAMQRIVNRLLRIRREDAFDEGAEYGARHWYEEQKRVMAGMGTSTDGRTAPVRDHSSSYIS